MQAKQWDLTTGRKRRKKKKSDIDINIYANNEYRLSMLHWLEKKKKFISFITTCKQAFRDIIKLRSQHQWMENSIVSASTKPFWYKYL